MNEPIVGVWTKKNTLPHSNNFGNEGQVVSPLK